MSRMFISAIALGSIFILTGIDIRMTPPNPYKSPPLIAFGSGLSGSGGFCGSLLNEASTTDPDQ